MSHHARLSPSNLRWPVCAGSVREEAHYVDIAGTSAIEGTGDHLLLETCITEGTIAATYIGRIIGVNHEDCPAGWMIHADRCDRVQLCLDYIATRVQQLHDKGYKVEVFSERRVNPGDFVGRDDWYGTADITIVARAFTEVIDFKSGRGWVSPDCTQLDGYAIGCMEEGQPEVIMQTIVQPKTEPSIRSIQRIRAELAGRVKDLGIAARATDDPNAPLVPGKHCTWCKANPKRGGHCTAAGEEAMTELTQAVQSDVAQTLQDLVADPTQLTEDRLAEIANARAVLTSVFDRVDAEIVSRLEHGMPVPGWAMKPGRATRKWAHDEETIANALKSRKFTKADTYPAKLISPAQALKHPKLNKQQQERLEKDYIATVAGEDRLTKVAIETPAAAAMFPTDDDTTLTRGFM